MGYRDCTVCGGRTSKWGFAAAAHERGKQHIAALRAQGFNNVASRLQAEADNVQARKRRYRRVVDVETEAATLIGSANGSALTRPPSHGGFREGSGRKPVLDGGIKRTFVLTPAHLARIDAWGRAYNFDNRSAALRHLIEQSTSPIVPHPRMIP